MLAVLHRGVIRTIGEQLIGSPLEDATPSLGEVVSFSRIPGGAWFCGRRSSNPQGSAARLSFRLTLSRARAYSPCL